MQLKFSNPNCHIRQRQRSIVNIFSFKSVVVSIVRFMRYRNFFHILSCNAGAIVPVVKSTIFQGLCCGLRYGLVPSDRPSGRAVQSPLLKKVANFALPAPAHPRKTGVAAKAGRRTPVTTKPKVAARKAAIVRPRGEGDLAR